MINTFLSKIGLRTKEGKIEIERTARNAQEAIAQIKAISEFYDKKREIDILLFELEQKMNKE